ncbi:MAG: hypothetical protein MMC23_003103 [Stictis urceolatum]|nr:hypothetical protein [Stictis urceolata]
MSYAQFDYVNHIKELRAPKGSTPPPSPLPLPPTSPKLKPLPCPPPRPRTPPLTLTPKPTVPPVHSSPSKTINLKSGDLLQDLCQVMWLKHYSVEQIVEELRGPGYGFTVTRLDAKLALYKRGWLR